MNVKVEWRSAQEDSGALSVMTAGTQLMLQLFVDSSDLQPKVRLRHVNKKKNLESEKWLGLVMQSVGGPGMSNIHYEHISLDTD